MQLLVTGTNFKTSPLIFRENFTFSNNEIESALLELKQSNHIKEIVIINTCHRIEIYAVVTDITQGQSIIYEFLLKNKNVSQQDINDYFYSYFNKFAVNHLFKVASGLDSMVLGEDEILGQVKRAWQQAQNYCATNSILNALFKFAITAGKRVRTETEIKGKSFSIGGLAKDMVKKICTVKKEHCNIALIGSGEIGQNTAKYMVKDQIKKFYIISRSIERAKKLAGKFSAIPLQLKDFYNLLPQLDVIIVCTSAPYYLIKLEDIQKISIKRKHPLLLLDLSVPRNIDPQIATINNVNLYNIDDLQAVIEKKEEQIRIIAQAEIIIREEITKFLSWFNSLTFTPVLSRLSKKFETISKSEIERALKKCGLNGDSNKIKKILNDVTKSITQKILHYPITQLKCEKDMNKKDKYVDTLITLFQIHEDEHESKYFYSSDEN